LKSLKTHAVQLGIFGCFETQHKHPEIHRFTHLQSACMSGLCVLTASLCPIVHGLHSCCLDSSPVCSWMEPGHNDHVVVASSADSSVGLAMAPAGYCSDASRKDSQPTDDCCFQNSRSPCRCCPRKKRRLLVNPCSQSNDLGPRPSAAASTPELVASSTSQILTGQARSMKQKSLLVNQRQPLRPSQALLGSSMPLHLCKPKDDSQHEVLPPSERHLSRSDSETSEDSFLLQMKNTLKSLG
jgi:hypothetical protein